MKTEDMPLDEMDEPHPFQGHIRENGPDSTDLFSAPELKQKKSPAKYP
ncbi:MAG: hypothetical protein AAB347_05260 [Bacteroidota bacterium]